MIQVKVVNLVTGISDPGNNMGYGAGEKIFKEDAPHDPKFMAQVLRAGTPASSGGSYNRTVYFQPINGLILQCLR